MTDVELFTIRKNLLCAFLREHDYDGILLSRQDNFAMATGGKRNFVGICSDMGGNGIFITRDGAAYFVGTNIEETRLMAEEMGPLNCGAKSFLWFDDTAAKVVERNFQGRFASDDGSLGDNVNAALATIRALLTPTELEKYRRLGALTAEAMTTVLDAIEPGMAEADIAAMLIAEGAKRRCRVPCYLIAADDRIPAFRHPRPTVAPLVCGSLQEKKVERYVMVVAGFIREGLVVSMTRFKQVDELPAALTEAHHRICAVDAIFQEATQPGRTLGDVFEAGQAGYVAQGFEPNEWYNHHQGGSTGYAGRTAKGMPGQTFPVLDDVWPHKVEEATGSKIPFGAAFAWNPSAPGVKSEDTFILHPDGTKEIVTPTPTLPQVDLAAVLGRDTEVVKSGMALLGT